MKSSALVEKEFKLRFGLKFCLFTVAGFLVMSVFLYTVMSKSLGGDYATAIYTIYDLKINIFSLVFASFYSIGILVFIALSIAAISVFFSHKMAGPVYRLEKDLERVSAGDLTVETRLRDRDQLMLLAEQQNRMVRSLNHIVRANLDALADIEKSEKRVRGLLKGGAKPAGEEMKKALGGLAFGVEELKRSAARVRLEDESL
ncbi:MAG: hypothetical protein ACE5EB_08125 [Thermodesulfobacteriota bacterium]